MIKSLEFTNSKGEKIKGILKEKNTVGPLLIVGHGLNSSKEHPASEGITDRLYTMGHSSFSFDFSKSAQNFSLKEQISDILDIINHFSNYTEVVLLAPSLGAVSMVIASAQSAKVTGLITINGFFGTAQLGLEVLKTYLMFRIFVLINKRYKENWKYFRQQYKPEKITSKTLVIHARHDEVVFISQSKTFFQKLGGKKNFHILEKGNHNLTRDADKQETAEVIDRWIKKEF